MVFDFLSLVYLTQYNNLGSIHLPINFMISVSSTIEYHYEYVPIFIIHSSVEVHLEVFPFPSYHE